MVVYYILNNSGIIIQECQVGINDVMRQSESESCPWINIVSKFEKKNLSNRSPDTDNYVHFEQFESKLLVYFRLLDNHVTYIHFV